MFHFLEFLSENVAFFARNVPFSSIFHQNLPLFLRKAAKMPLFRPKCGKNVVKWGLITVGYGTLRVMWPLIRALGQANWAFRPVTVGHRPGYSGHRPSRWLFEALGHINWPLRWVIWVFARVYV